MVKRGNGGGGRKLQCGKKKVNPSNITVTIGGVDEPHTVLKVSIDWLAIEDNSTITDEKGMVDIATEKEESTIAI